MDAEQRAKNFVDIWEPKKGKDKLTCFIHNTYEAWVVLWISCISYFFSSMISAIMFLCFSLLFIGMNRTQTKRFTCNIIVTIVCLIVWAVCVAMKVIYIMKLKDEDFEFDDPEKFKQAIIFNELVGIPCKYHGDKNDLEDYLKEGFINQKGNKIWKYTLWSSMVYVYDIMVLLTILMSLRSYVNRKRTITKLLLPSQRFTTEEEVKK